jgi:carbonic anhydrase
VPASVSPTTGCATSANVIEQVANVCQTTVVRDAWSRGQTLSVHGWIYGLHDGRMRDLAISVSATDELAAAYERAIASLKREAAP